MSRGLGWTRGTAYCEGTNRDGTPCGNKVPRGDSGYIIRRLCHVHARMQRAERQRQRAQD